jgi:hypothetical protein
MLMSLNKLLNYQGRLTFVNSVLCALPTFFLCTFKVPIYILEQANKYIKKWTLEQRGCQQKRGLFSSMEKCNSTKESGGLGILDLRAQNTALLLKHLHKLLTR